MINYIRSFPIGRLLFFRDGRDNSDNSDNSDHIEIIL